MKATPKSKTPAAKGGSLRRLALRWTKRPPRRVGYYWYRHTDQHEQSVLQITEEDFGPNRDLFVRTGPGQDDTNFIENYDGEWAGPIPQPQSE